VIFLEEKKETVSVSGVISEEMFQKFMAYHIKALNKVAMPVILSAFFLLVWLFVNLNWIASLIITIILWGIAHWMLAKSIKFRATKEYKSNRQIRNEVFLTFDEDGIRQKRHKSETFWEWDDIILIHEKRELFLFYVSKNTAVLLPKNFMVNHELTNLRKIIHNNALTQKVKLLEEAV
jgi:hypothetical protein